MGDSAPIPDVHEGWKSDGTPTVKFPSRLIDLKKRIIPESAIPNVVKAWNEVIEQLSSTTERFNATKQENIPSIDFSSIASGNVAKDKLDEIRRCGCVVIRNIADDAQALEWKRLLQEYIDANPQVEGFPVFNKQFFELYWSRSQLEARAHPNVLAATTFLNEFFAIPPTTTSTTNIDDELVDLSTPLVYADRFRIRKPNKDAWTVHPPHIDGASVEKWEDDKLREGCYRDILDGNWKQHNPYDMRGRLIGNADKYGRPNQASVFRTWQGWLAMSETGPGEGTIRFFPDIALSNAYLLLRPFFSPVQTLPEIQSNPTRTSSSTDLEAQAVKTYLAPDNWKFDTSSPEFPGISPIDGGKLFSGQKLGPQTHPHMRLDRESSMISVPKVYPGDMVFWHCDGVHSVETLHNGTGDSSVMYIPAVPLTPMNLAYAVRQRDHFLAGLPGPDFPQDPAHVSEANLVKKGTIENLGTSPVALRSMGVGNVGFDVEEKGLDERAKRMRIMANEMLYSNA
ncbi:DUF1479-domain-containing protein [Clavulina sp. PMI_390]|nr:DUF1479-domain-containing protein [Clavulina sp. PMI_390]